MSGIPLSGTMNPKPLETSNHLMTPLNSMRSVAVSSTISLTTPWRRLVPDIFDSTPSDAMTPNAATLLAPLDGRLNESCGIEDNTGLQTAKGQNRLAHSSIHSVARGESVRDERTQRVADVITHDEISNFVKVRGLSIDDDEGCTTSLGHQRETCRRPNHERGADSEKKIAISGQFLGALHRLQRHLLAE